jgi:hypothetical protein
MSQLFDEGWALVDENFLGARAPFNRGAWASEREAAHATPLRSRAAAHARLASALATLRDPYTRFVAPDDFPALSRYDVVVVDEAHERHVSTDLLLGMLKTLSRRRQNLRVVVMSATIDVDKFAAFFECVPI